MRTGMITWLISGRLQYISEFQKHWNTCTWETNVYLWRSWRLLFWAILLSSLHSPRPIFVLCHDTLTFWVDAPNSHHGPLGGGPLPTSRVLVPCAHTPCPVTVKDFPPQAMAVPWTIWSEQTISNLEVTSDMLEIKVPKTVCGMFGHAQPKHVRDYISGMRAAGLCTKYNLVLSDCGLQHVIQALQLAIEMLLVRFLSLFFLLF